jgi:elongation factor Ts
MAQITAQMVKELREATGAGPLDCKKALEMNDGDVQKAIDYLREKGIAKAAKKLGAGRTMNEGRVESYIHFNNRLGVLIEVNCETDFVAATEAFINFTKDVALHIANMAPEYVNRDDVPDAVVQAEREVQLNRAKEEGKPAEIAEKMVEGRMNKEFFGQLVLMEQPFIKDDSKTISDLLQETVAEVGESIQISRFARYALGESGDEGDE